MRKNRLRCSLKLAMVPLIFATLASCAAPTTGGTVPCAANQAARRFAGWSMVLGAIGYMLAWLFAPLDSAALFGGGVLAAALLIAIVRCLRAGGRRAET